ncbi:putative sugar O-methyltransferase [Falsihalocynthiibacter sp. SS001]|uniref:putative sugar O-methyltransferase n=1 Tax=Falsihalocynthiibacter sp. SS001 TaxID=3349698 RepID=UPI0036D3F5C7
MNETSVLRQMLSDMETAPEEFKPTNFWNSGLNKIVDDIETLGIETFRSHPSGRFFYVPAYMSKTYAKRPEFFDRLLDMLPPRKRKRLDLRLKHPDRARADYRIYRASAQKGGLDLDCVSEGTEVAGERFEFDGRLYSHAMLNYLRALNLLKREVDTTNIQSCLEIGGGYGTLGEIFLKAQEGGIYVNVDIPPVAAVSTWYLQQIFGADRVLDYSQSREMDEINLEDLKGKYSAVVLCPWQLPKLKGQFDLFANFMSFQEMEPAVVANYISLVQPLVAGNVLVRNHKIGKKVAKKVGEVGVLEQVTTGFIVEKFNEFEVLARDCFVHGQLSEDGAYQSEVIVLGREQPT